MTTAVKRRKPTGIKFVLPEVFDSILADLAAGISATKALKARNVHNDAFWQHIARNPRAGELYAAARARGLERHAASLFDLASDQSIDPETRRLQIDVSKWTLSKLLPKKYGDLLHLEHSGTIDLALELDAARKRMKDADSGVDSGVPALEHLQVTDRTRN